MRGDGPEELDRGGMLLEGDEEGGAVGLMRSKKTQGRRQIASSLVGLGSKEKPIHPERREQMQSTEPMVDCLKGLAQAHPDPLDWQSACEQVKDPRRKQGQRFSITSILLLALAAILSNHLSELAIAQWGAGQSEEIKKALGFETG